MHELYVKKSVLEGRTLHETLFAMSNRGFVAITAQNDDTDPLVKEFIKDNNLIMLGTDGAGNEAETFYLKEAVK